MRRKLHTVLFVAALTLGAAGSTPAAVRSAPQAQPRQPAQPAAEPSREGQASKKTEPRRAEPRRPSEPQREAPPRREAEPRRMAPPPRVMPPQFDRVPRVYYFPPVSLQRGFYYHPYFGFYYGPYYGPYYPFPGPFFGPPRYSSSAIRTKVRPAETEVYLNGYYAGLADDFDGLFQRLALPSGEHEIEFYLAGYRTFRRKIYVGPGDTFEIVHQMQPLAPGESTDPVSSPRKLRDGWTNQPPAVAGDRPASPFGILAIRVEPSDAEIYLDGEAWAGLAGRPESVVHLTAGWHTLEIRKAGYQPFKTDLDLSEGATTRLNVKLAR